MTRRRKAASSQRGVTTRTTTTRSRPKSGAQPEAAKPREKSRSLRGHGLLLIAAVLITLVAGAYAWDVWHRLPGAAWDRIDWQALRDARERYSGRVRTGYILAAISDNFTEVLHYPDLHEPLLHDARQAAPHVRDSALPRLQVAALHLLGLERQGVPPAEWWPRVRSYLEGLEQARFDHFLAPLLDAEAAVLHHQGVPLGAARRIPLLTFEGTHGPFVQSFAERMQTLAETLRAAGQDSDATYGERLCQRLLRQWVLDPGPPGLRLTAAELLAEQLAPDAATTQPATAPSATAVEPHVARVAADLRAWRAAYHDAAAGLPVPLGVLRIDNAPLPVQTTGLVKVAGLALWCGAALAVTILVALVANVLALRSAGAARAKLPVLVGLVVAVVILGVGWLVIGAYDETLMRDLLRLGDFGRAPSPRYPAGWPRLPLVGGSLALVAVGVGGCFTNGRGRCLPGLTGIARASLGAWLSLAVLLLVLAMAADRLLAEQEQVLARPPGDQLAVIAGPEAGLRLESLRAWQP